MSVVHIIYPETMDESNSKPREQGLNDPKLGTIDRMYSCATCKEDIQVCPGHFGHIELATPVFHVGESTIRLQMQRARADSPRIRRKDQEDLGDGVPQLRTDPG